MGISEEKGDQKVDEVLQPTPTELTYRNSIMDMIKHAGPFALSRLSVALNGLGNGIVLARLDKNAVAAGPPISTMTYAVMGTIRGMMLATGVFVGEAHGAKEDLKVGQIIRQSWLLGLVLTIPATGILLSTEQILNATGIDPDVSSAAQDFFTPFVIGIAPTMWLASDQQLALGIKRSKITLVAGTGYAFGSMLIGYPLVFGSLGLPKLGIAGIGLGTSISAWATMLSLRAYYFFNADFKKYGLFSCSFYGITNDLKKFMKIALPLGLQRTTEWGNLLAISLIMGSISKNALAAEQVVLQPMAAFNLVLLGLAQATGVAVSNNAGKIKKALSEGRTSDVVILKKNTQIIGNSGVALGVLSSAVIATLFIGIPKPIISAFVDSEDAKSEEIITLAQAFLLINGIGLLFDSACNVTAGALGGIKDVIFAPALRFLMMSVLALSAGGCSSLLFDSGVNWLFITRDIGILLAAIGVAHRWITRSNTYEPPRDTQNLIAHSLVMTAKSDDPLRERLLQAPVSDEYGSTGSEVIFNAQ